MSEYGYIPEAPEQSFGNNKGIFTPKDIYDLTRADKYTNYGQLELIETQTVSSVATVEFTDLGNYNVHFLTINDLKVVNDNNWLQVRFYESGVLETASVYQFANQVGVGTGTFYEARTTGNGYLQFMSGANVGNSTNERGNAYCYFYNLTDSSKYSFMTHQCVSTYDTNGMVMNFGSGVMPQASAVDGIQLILAGGNIDSSDISLYGIRYS
jgi:hypothetical protein